MCDNKTSYDILPKANGERGAMGGYLPQYDEFACRVYDCIIDESLEEIRVADAEENVGKLDDICYVTTGYVHAYQLKWSNIDDSFKYNDFCELLPTLVDGWRKLGKLYPAKVIVPHLLTNRKCSTKDRSIKNKEGQIVGAFSDFVSGVLEPIKRKMKIDTKWDDIITDIKEKSTLTKEEWQNFWTVFVFTHEYQQEIVDIQNVAGDKRTEDILALNRLIQQMAASKERQVKKTTHEILKELHWDLRLTTNYNHSLFVLPSTYEPISAAIGLLDEQLSSRTKGYIFLQGTPGSGKSTILTQWSEKIPNKHIRYYAFDFTNPSSHSNNDDHRGDETTFLFDMVRMIEKEGFRLSNRSLPFMDYHDLKQRFYNLLSVISESYKDTGLTTVLIIDGLDHITREYVNCSQTLIRTLPSVDEVPEGVVFVLGSQQYENLPLDKSIKDLYHNGTNTIVMPSFGVEEVENLSKRILHIDIIDAGLLETIIEKSQGHPLYLRYLLSLICENGDAILKNIPAYSGEIEGYYESVLGKWIADGDMKHFLGLLSRVIGTINLGFVKEWKQNEQVLINFRKQLHHLFMWDDNLKSISFFHNSFRQYLLEKTAIDALSNQYDEEKNRGYYKELASFYHISKVEPVWNEAAYLYHAAEYESFLQLVSPDKIQEHLWNFRPIWHVMRDIRNAVRLAAERQDVYLLTRYMLYKSQLDQMSMQDYSALTLTEELIQLGYIEEAKMQIREHRILMCSQNYALRLARIFKERKDTMEANTLFELGYPEFLSHSINEFHNRYNEIQEHMRTLKEWVRTAILFMEIDQVDGKIAGFVNYLRTLAEHDNEQFDEEYSTTSLRRSIIKSLIREGRWEELDHYIDIHFSNDDIIKYITYRDAIYRLSEINNKGLLPRYEAKLVEVFNTLPEEGKPFLQMAISYMKLGHSIEDIRMYLDKVEWSSLGSFYLSGFRESFDKILPHLRYLELRSLCGFDDRISELVVPDKSKADNAMMEDYARKLFCLAKIKGFANAKKATLKDLTDLLVSLLPFLDDVKRNHHNRYQYTISSQRKEVLDYAVSVASAFGNAGLVRVAEMLKLHYQLSTCNIESEEIRHAILSLYHSGIDKDYCVSMLEDVEKKMLNYQDLDGRTSAMYNQGKAWLEIGERERAEILFRQMIIESFGVGYRKDYQPTLFSEWIGIANKVDPDNAIERIHWMTSRMKYLDDVSESRICTRAAAQLMDDSFKLNLGLGCQLSKWSLDNEYGYFESVSGIVLNALLNAVKSEDEFRGVFYVYTHLHLYTLSTSDIDKHLLRQICEVGKAICKTSFDWYEKDLRRCILTQCNENYQESLLSYLDELLSNVNTDQPETESCNPRPSSALCSEAEKLLAEGSEKEAWLKCLSAVEESSESGWVRFYDGGTRQDACRLLVSIDPEKGRKYSNNLLGEDICNSSCYSLMNDWDEILSFLSDDINELMMFTEKKSYMERILRENTIQSQDCPNLQFTEQGVIEILCEWLLYISNMHVMCVAEKAKMTLSRMIAEGIADASYTKECNDAIRLELAMYVKELEPSRLGGFRELARNYCLSTNYLLRLYSQAILRELKETIPNPPKITLPGIYSLVIPEKQSFDFNQKHSRYDGYVDWDDPNSVMSVVSHIQTYLSDITGFEKININTRAYQLLLNTGRVADWDDSADKKVGQHYHNIGLDYPYIRPRALAAINSMMETASELLDSGIIGGPYYDSVFLTTDFSAIRVEENVKPYFIQRIADKNAFVVDKGWEKKCAESTRFTTCLQEFNDKHVIGEWTRIVKPDDDVPSEEFKMKISVINEIPDAYSFFGSSPYQRSTSEYLDTGYDDPHVILVRNGYFAGDKLVHKWIAINPVCAFSMGWHPSATDLFAWDDEGGDRMVESIFWQCGNINYRGRSNHEASEGWLVVASPKALDILKSCYPIFSIQMVMRGNLTDYTVYDNKDYRIIPLN